MRHALPDIPGVLSSEEVDQTIDFVAGLQTADGNIPWVPGGHTDPWNLVESIMALDVGGRIDEARLAYQWLANKQLDDGGWHAYYIADAIKDPTRDTNISAYIANGIWHHFVTTNDLGYMRAQWPMVERAIDYVLSQQRETGEINWRSDDPDDGALLTGSSSIHSSIRCAIAIAEHVGCERPDWEISLASLAVAVAHRPEHFLNKNRWAMDWYYPILGGVLRGPSAQARLAGGWDSFVAYGRGVLCVSDAPWVTASETCEFVMALDALGDTHQAHDLFRWVQFLRDPETGGYYTGMNFPERKWEEIGEHFPVEQTAYTAASVVLAANALVGTGPTAGLFRGETLPVGLSADELLAAGVEIERDRARARAHEAANATTPEQ